MVFYSLTFESHFYKYKETIITNQIEISRDKSFLFDLEFNKKNLPRPLFDTDWYYYQIFFDDRNFISC